MTTPTRPLLRYHGGKWNLAPWIIGYFPAHRVYTEAYGGGASVLLRKPRSYAEVYNDLDGMVIVSGYACGLYEDMFEGWQRVERSAHADGARDRIEVLWIKPGTVVQPTLYTDKEAAL